MRALNLRPARCALDLVQNIDRAIQDYILVCLTRRRRLARLGVAPPAASAIAVRRPIATASAPRATYHGPAVNRHKLLLLAVQSPACLDMLYAITRKIDK